MAKKVCIDAGHYGKYNRCPANANYYESEVMWKLHLLQKKYLEMLGIEVVTTRTEQAKDLALTSRGRTAKGCDLFISNHSNAVGNGMNEDVDHVAVYHLTDDNTTKADDISKEIANKIAPVIADVMGVEKGYKVLTRKDSTDRNKDGILNDNYYGVLHGARLVNVAGLILEHSFHTNTNTVEWLLNDDNLDKLAKAEAECIASYLLDKKVTLADNKADEPEETIYRVQVGAYSNKENAEKQLEVVKEKGFDCFITEVDNLFKVQVGAFGIKENADRMLEKMKKAGFEAFITTKSGTKVPSTIKEPTKSAYYPKYKGTSYKVDEVFKIIGVESKYIGSWSKRKPIAVANGIGNDYAGTAIQNGQLIALAKAGKLKRV